MPKALPDQQTVGLFSVFHQQFLRIFQANDKLLDDDLTEDDIIKLLLELEPINILYNIADGKMIQLL